MFRVKLGDIIPSETTNYQVLKFNGQGCFGKVAKCLDLTTNKTVAVKIQKQSDKYYIRQELDMLQAISGLDPDQCNIVRFIEHFKYDKLSFTAFEMLDQSFLDLKIRCKEMWPLSLNNIRYVARQLLVALDGLKSAGIMHTDLKLDNIMLVDQDNQPFKTKLIDFGLAMRECQVSIGTIIQNRAYRAPEVSLGLPLTTAVDMWGLGCVIGELFFGRTIFPENCDYNNMRAIVSMLGFPDDDKLETGKYSHLYFTREMGGMYRLATPREYQQESCRFCLVESSFCDEFSRLDDAVLGQPGCQDDLEYSDRMAFLDFLKCCLNVDADRRISPRRALMHRFITDTKMDQIPGGIHGDSAFEASCNRNEDHHVPDIHNNIAHSSGSEKGHLSGGESHNEPPIAMEPPAAPSREQGEEENNLLILEIMQQLCIKIKEVQHINNEVKRLFEAQQEITKAVREEVHLLKEKNIKMQAAKASKTSNHQENVLAPQDLMQEEKKQKEEKDSEEQVVEPAPERSHMNTNQTLDVSEQPVPMKNRLPWWQRLKKFFSGARCHRKSNH